MSGTRPAGGPSASSTSRRHLAGVDRLDPEPGRDGYDGQPGHLPRCGEDQVVELGRAQRCPRQARLGHDALGGQLGCEVAEHGAVDAADDRDSVGPDDRDVHQVPRPDPRRRPDQVQGLILVALAAARAVHDDLSPFQRGFDSLARGQVTGHVLGTLPALAAAPAEHPYPAAGVPQPRDDEAPNRARAASDKNAIAALGSRFHHFTGLSPKNNETPPPRRWMSRRSPLAQRGALPRAQLYSDPLQHAVIAAAVAAPLVPRAGWRVILTAVAAATVIDVDHAVAARSLRIKATTSLATRPRTHSVLTALGAGALVAVAAGPVHGWAAFGGLASHLLHDAGDRAAPTPLLWPFARARQLGRRRQLVGTAILALGSVAIGRATAASARGRSAAGAGGDVAAARPRTA
jgi:LexA-binding, inner membrane-associated putative hydrolase